MKMPKSIIMVLLLNLEYLVDSFKLMLVLALNHLGLFKPSEHMIDSMEEPQLHSNYILMMDRLCPAMVPVNVLTKIIKKLPVVEFGQDLGRYNGSEDEGQAIVCNICLDCIERSHEVREQCNCEHVFHRECLDCWVDQGQVTCPLCRSMLFPARTSVNGVGCFPF